MPPPPHHPPPPPPPPAFLPCLRLRGAGQTRLLLCVWHYERALRRRTCDAMTRYYCDYCDTYLTHDSVRQVLLDCRTIR